MSERNEGSCPAPCSRATDPAKALLNEIIVTMKHARTFIVTREKMNQVGVEQYDELVSRIDGIANAHLTGQKGQP